MQRVKDLPTPALVVVQSVVEENLALMARALPGERLRPHVKAHKSTDLARRQREHGHLGFTAATIREVEGLHLAGLAQDVLLANEVIDARRIGALVSDGARVTLAVDSMETIDAASAGGVREVLIDINVGLPRCGCQPERAGELAAYAKSRRLEVHGVMGYEGHLMFVEDPTERLASVRSSMEQLAYAHDLVGGEVVSSGGTGTYREHLELGVASEVQAGSYPLMDSAYTKVRSEFAQALWLVDSVISVSDEGWAVANSGLKSHGMDHGNPRLMGHDVWFLSDEHTVFSNDKNSHVNIGDRVAFVPAHVDPTVAMHEQMWLVEGISDDDRVLARWAVDLRHW